MSELDEYKKAQQYLVMLTAFFAVMTLALGLALLLVMPKQAELAEGFHTPIIAFEFARTEADVAFLTGTNEVAVLNRNQMDKGHQWDMFFLVAYTGFVVSMLIQQIFQGVGLAVLGIPVALLMIPFDLNENLHLLSITDALRQSKSVLHLLAGLHITTWLKWGAVACSFGFLSIGFLKTKQYYTAACGVVAAVSIVTAWVSNSAPLLLELMSLLVLIFFVFSSVLAMRNAWQLLRP